MPFTKENPLGIGLGPVEAALRAALPQRGVGHLRAELVAGGRSNLTYRLADESQAWVLRRPPHGQVLETAHDMAREYRVLSALYPTDVPVPRPILFADASILGVPFYVMDYVEGLVVRTHRQLEAMTGTSRLVIEELIGVLIRLHRLDPRDVGLQDLGRPNGYLERQLRRWSRQLQACGSSRLPALERLAASLHQTLPTHSQTSIVHGDYRLDNVMFAPKGPQIVAVLDWEMATLGDPLTDLASAVVWWDGLCGLENPVTVCPGDVPGFPDSGRLIDAYSRQSDANLMSFPWYIAFAYFKIAAIFEGIDSRARGGLAVDEGFDELGRLVPELVNRGESTLASASMSH
jgi:aminoglycoside phosphotransferase (APT) family kinase protein